MRFLAGHGAGLGTRLEGEGKWRYIARQEPSSAIRGVAMGTSGVSGPVERLVLLKGSLAVRSLQAAIFWRQVMKSGWIESTGVLV